MRVSVAMAVYNGEKYIREQLQSILCQLAEGDEVVISDNGSTDKSVQIIGEYAQNDGRIKLIFENRKGVVANFENAVKNTSGDIIFLCDQDDVWKGDKVKRVVERFEQNKNTALVLHSCEYVDEDLEPLNKVTAAYRGYYKNLIKNSFRGACMAFSSDIKPLILPFYEGLVMHDIFIGLLVERLRGHIEVIKESLIYYRRHEATVTGRKKNSLVKKLSMRASIAKSVSRRMRELKRSKG